MPIHYDLLNQPPEYTQTPRAAERFAAKAKELGVTPLIPARGEWFSAE